jgi:hypothetical protein
MTARAFDGRESPEQVVTSPMPNVRIEAGDGVYHLARAAVLQLADALDAADCLEAGPNLVEAPDSIAHGEMAMIADSGSRRPFCAL